MTGADGAAQLDTGEVAALLQVSPDTVRRYAARGRLLAARTPGGRLRFFGAEVRALLAGEEPAKARALGEAERDRLSGTAPASGPAPGRASPRSAG